MTSVDETTPEAFILMVPPLLEIANGLIEVVQRADASQGTALLGISPSLAVAVAGSHQLCVCVVFCLLEALFGVGVLKSKGTQPFGGSIFECPTFQTHRTFRRSSTKHEKGCVSKNHGLCELIAGMLQKKASTRVFFG